MQETRTGYDQADGSARELIRHTRRVTRRRFTPEEKVRIVIEGIRGEIPISTLCRREGIRSNVYYKHNTIPGRNKWRKLIYWKRIDSWRGH